MDHAHGSPDWSKEATTTTQPYNSGLEVAPNQPPLPPPTWDQPQTPQPLIPQPQERTICGLRRTTFILLVALIVVIIAAAVGGGVGGSLAVQNARKSAASCASASGVNTVVSTVTATAAATATGTGTATSDGLTVPTGVLKTDCPNLDSNQVISLGTKSWTFAATCGTDYVGNDFGAVIVYSFRDCLQACAAHNHFSGENSCTAATFRANQTEQIPKNYGNCWLKNGTGQTLTGIGNAAIAAQLESTS
ncbi:hypothetical protein F5B20DRAFT_558911 [Whalleya microplaca]|nr:hypothetical protein F5B20DRAFT_558911 [Whalleya microplaca]